MRADVGVGTLYRRFPNKADLLNAVVEAAHERKRQIAEAVLADVAPGDGVFEFVRRCIAVPSCWRATISAPPWRTSGTGLGQTAPLLQEILERSQRAGSVRPDIAGGRHRGGAHGGALHRRRLRHEVLQAVLRFLELLLDGLRPGHEAPVHDPLTIAQLDRILRQR